MVFISLRVSGVISIILCRFKIVKTIMMKMKLFLMVVSIFASASIHAQNSISLYEFQYHFDNDAKKYNAFLFRNQDGTGFIRVRFNNKAIVIDNWQRWDSLLFCQLPPALRFTVTTSLCEDAVRPWTDSYHPHPPFPPLEGTPIPISLQVLVLLPKARVFDLVSSTFMCFLYCLSYLAIYLSLHVCSSLFCF